VFIDVDLSEPDGAVALRDAGDCGRFHVAARGGTDRDRLGAALERSGVGSLADGEDVWISVDAVRRLADGQVEPAWAEQFAGMLAYARTKGWLNPGEDSIRAHCEWTAVS
jgi:hypothetical protein